MKRSADARRLDCLGLGIVPLDILLTVPHFPEAGGKIDAENMTIQGGGPVPNALVGLARLGATTALVAAVGKDIFGRLSVAELRSEGVDTAFVVVKKDPSATAAGLIEIGSGRRTIALHRKIKVRPADLLSNKYPVPRIIHLDGRDLDACLQLAKWGKKVGASISFDIGSVRNDVAAIFPLVDHLVVADAFALPFTGRKTTEAVIRRLAEHCPGEIVVTEGIRGSVGFDRQRFFCQPAYKVRCVDTTGAGDSFHAGYLYGVLQSWPMPERLRFGAACAALKCTRPGARTGAPRLAAVTRFLKGSPEVYA